MKRECDVLFAHTGTHAHIHALRLYLVFGGKEVESRCVVPEGNGALHTGMHFWQSCIVETFFVNDGTRRKKMYCGSLLSDTILNHVF